MPIYEYECRGCGELHEFIQKFSDSPKRKCPSCGRLRLKKLISAAAFHLKGDGWYVTDFRDKGKGKDKGKSDSRRECGRLEVRVEIVRLEVGRFQVHRFQVHRHEGRNRLQVLDWYRRFTPGRLRSTAGARLQASACFFSSRLSWWYPSPRERAATV